MRVFLQAIYGQLILNAYIIRRGYQALPSKSLSRRLFVLFFVLELLLYFTGYFFYKDLPDSILLPIMLVCNTWYIASIYIVMGLLGLNLVRFIMKKCRWNSLYMDKHQAKIKLSLFFIVAFIVTGLMIKAYHSAVYPIVKHVDIHIPKVLDGRDSLTIVLMSDLHIGEAIGKKHVQRFVELCNVEHPDLIVIAGDLIDYESRFAEKAHIEDDLQRLNAPLGVYMTLGNHEYRANRFAKLRWIEKIGGTLLIDSVVMPDSTFYLIGRDDATNLGRVSLESLMQGVDLTKPVIVVDHQPVFAQDVINNQCDLGLFGHTHNGQYWPFPLLFKLVYEFSYGYFLRENTHLYVSSGIGFAGPPYRIGTRSELVVIHLKFRY